jgi:hypothetical protein
MAQELPLPCWLPIWEAALGGRQGQGQALISAGSQQLQGVFGSGSCICLYNLVSQVEIKKKVWTEVIA